MIPPGKGRRPIPLPLNSQPPKTPAPHHRNRTCNETRPRPRTHPHTVPRTRRPAGHATLTGIDSAPAPVPKAAPKTSQIRTATKPQPNQRCDGGLSPVGQRGVPRRPCALACARRNPASASAHMTGPAPLRACTLAGSVLRCRDRTRVRVCVWPRPHPVSFPCPAPASSLFHAWVCAGLPARGNAARRRAAKRAQSRTQNARGRGALRPCFRLAGSRRKGLSCACCPGSGPPAGAYARRKV